MTFKGSQSFFLVKSPDCWYSSPIPPCVRASLLHATSKKGGYSHCNDSLWNLSIVPQMVLIQWTGLSSSLQITPILWPGIKKAIDLPLGRTFITLTRGTSHPTLWCTEGVWWISFWYQPWQEREMGLMMTDRREREGCWWTQRRFVPVFLTFTGGQLAFQLVVPVSFGRQRRLGFFLIQAVQAAFGLQGGERRIKSIQNRWGNSRWNREEHVLAPGTHQHNSHRRL